MGARWVVEHSRPVVELADQTECAALVRAIGTNLDGSPAAPLTMRTRRSELFHVLQHARGADR